MIVREFQACLEAVGTRRGYRRHTTAKQAACEPCREANAAYERESREKRLGRPIRTPQPCGTPAAYRRHMHHKEVACDPCLAAWAEYERDRTDSTRKTPRRKGQGPKSAAAKAARRAAREIETEQRAG